MKILRKFPAYLIFCLLPFATSHGAELVSDDFSSYETGDAARAFPSSSLGDWIFAPLNDTDGTVTAAVDAEGNPVLQVRQPMPEGGRGNWHLFRKFDSPVALDSGGKMEFQTRIWLADSDQPSDFVFGLISPDLNGLPHDHEYLTFMRFYVVPESDIFQFRYHVEGDDTTEPTYITVTSFSVIQNEWYTIDALFDLSTKTYSFRITNDQGEALAQVSDIPFRRNLLEIGGVAFKNRTTNPNRSANFDLDRVSVRYLPRE